MLKNKRVIVTGAKSMVGKSVIEQLSNQGCIIIPVYHEECDLLDFHQCLRKFENAKADYCIHAAGYNGNINFNKKYPSDIFYNTTIIGLNTLKSCALTGVKKVVTLLASCAYQSTNEELKEEDFFKGMPDDSVEAHGLSKKSLFYYSKQISKQYNIKAVCTIFNTAYGPHDSFDINKTKVVGGLIKKFTDAVCNGEEEVVCWGTGKPRRELIFCDDAAKGVVQVLEKYDDEELPINLGHNADISIRELADKISTVVGYKHRIVWDESMPDGQYRKILNSDRMRDYGIHIEDPTSLYDGLTKTIAWYEENVK